MLSFMDGKATYVLISIARGPAMNVRADDLVEMVRRIGEIEVSLHELKWDIIRGFLK